MATFAIRHRWSSVLMLAGLLAGSTRLSLGAPAAAAEPPDPTTLAAASERPESVAWTYETPFPLSGVVHAWGQYFPANGKFYVLGGRRSDAAGTEIFYPREYYPLGQTWAGKFSAFPDNQTSDLVGGVLNVSGTDYIVLVGGAASGATTATSAVLAYDPILDAGATLTTDPWPGNISGAVLPGGAAVHANKLYVFGGYDIGTGMVNKIWSFDPMAAAGSRWTQMAATLPTPLGYIPTATSGGFIYLLGGSEYVAGNLTDSTHAYRFDPQGGSIVAVASLPRPTGETRAVAQRDGKIWVLGGGRTPPSPSNEVDVYDPATNSWSLGPSMIASRRNFAADVNPSTGEVFAVGGYAPTTASNTTERWSSVIFNNGFELGALCFWSNTADVYYYTTNSGASIVPGTTDTGNHADDGSTWIPLPFPYQIYGLVLTSVAVGSNGHLTFGVVNDSGTVSCLPVAYASYVIAPYWTDQCTTACPNTGCSGCGIFTSISGTAPRRIFNIEYRTRYYDSGGDGVPLNYEVRLFEGQMGFEVIYGTINPFTPPDGRELSVGVQFNAAPNNFTRYGCDPTGGTAPPIPPAGRSLIFAACAAP